MAYYTKPVLTLLLISNIFLAIAGPALAGREVPKDAKKLDKKQPQSFIAGREVPKDAKNVDKKQPQSFIDTDGSFLIPGIGRFMLPDVHHGFNPFTYNPITGISGGGPVGGFGDDIIGSGGGASRSYIPGGDDTLVPNPGVEVPIPGSSGSATLAAAHP